MSRRVVSWWVLIVVIVVGLSLAPLSASSSSTPHLRLRTGTFDPTHTGDFRGLSELNGLAAGPQLLIVQFDHPPTEADKAALVQAGAEIGDYLPEYAYLVRIDRAAAAGLAGLKGVRWLGAYRPAYRIDPAISRRTTPGPVVVETWPGRAEDVAKSLTSPPPPPLAEKGDGGLGSVATTLRLDADAATVQQLATSPDVVWIGPTTHRRLYNDVARSSRIMRIETAWARGLFGAGQIVAVADSGLDVGDLGRMSADFAGRIVATLPLTGTTWNDPVGHGTHVAGSVLGNGRLSGSDPATHQYTGSLAGMAPEARLVVQSFQVDTSSGEIFGLPDDLDRLFGPAYAVGARIHSNSWGGPADDPANPYGVYTTEARMIDRFVWQRPDFLPVFASGNGATDGNFLAGDMGDGVVDPDSLSVAGTAKNALTVGATESLRSSGGYAGAPWLLFGLNALFGSGGSFFADPIMTDDVSNNPEGMAAFSGRGPTDDGRIKPDLVAPGTNIVSTRSFDPGFDPTSYSWGVYEANDKYVFNGGTSMATPLVSGAAALVREFLQKQGLATPSAALVKAMLLHHASDIAPGQYGEGATREMANRPNPVEGWGRLDLGTLFPTVPTQQWFVDHTAGLRTGDQAVFANGPYRLHVVDTSVPLRVTLTWSDYPAALAAGSQLVNDLDLFVISPAGVYHPFTIDRLNNVEMADIVQPEPGVWLIAVNAHNIPMGPQPFALVVSGGLSGGQVTPTPTPTPYTGPRPYSVYLPFVIHARP